MIKIFCDRCKKEIIDGNLGYIAVNIKDQRSGDLLEDNEFETSHFCMGCTEKIREFVRKEVEPRQTASKEKNPDQKDGKPERQGRNNIDIGKIMALRKAGWSNKEIAAEMHMTPQAVSYQICVYRKKNHLDGQE